MNKDKDKDKVIVRPQEDGRVEYDVPISIDMGQEVIIIVNRGNGDEVNIEKD